MLSPPPSVIATWPAPNYDNPIHQTNLNVVFVAFNCLAVAAVLLRLFVRFFLLHSAGLDDLFVTIAVFPCVGTTVGALIGTSYGIGYHVWDVSPEWYPALLLWNWIVQLLFIIAIVFTKLGILFSYRRLSNSPRLTIAINLTTAYVMLWGVSFVFTLVFKCTPIDSYWKDNGHCLDEAVPVMVSSVTNTISDFWLVFLPIPTLWKLQLPMRQRWFLIFVMSLGVFTGACGIIRIYYLHITMYTSYDVTWHSYKALFWTTAESSGSIICTSLPPLRAIVSHVYPRLLDRFHLQSFHNDGHEAGDCLHQDSLDSGTVGRLESDGNGDEDGNRYAGPPCSDLDPERGGGGGGGGGGEGGGGGGEREAGGKWSRHSARIPKRTSTQLLLPKEELALRRHKNSHSNEQYLPDHHHHLSNHLSNHTSPEDPSPPYARQVVEMMEFYNNNVNNDVSSARSSTVVMSPGPQRSVRTIEWGSNVGCDGSHASTIQDHAQEHERQRDYFGFDFRLREAAMRRSVYLEKELDA